MSVITARLHAVATGTYPARPVAVLRIVLGAAAFLRASEAIRVFERITPQAVLKIPWATWIPEPTTGLVSAVIGVWAVSALLFAAGYHSRITGGLLAASMAVSIALDQQAYANHLYLLVVLVTLTTLAQPDSATSPKARNASERVPGWPVLLIKIQVTVVYAFAALTKLNDDFLGGGVLRGNLGGGVLDIPGWMLERPTVQILAAVVVVTELSIAALLWVPTRRPIAIGLGVLLHVSIPLLLAGPIQLVVFSTEMLAAYVLFLNVEPHSRQVVWDDSCDFCAGWKQRLGWLDTLQATEWIGSRSEAERVAQLGVAKRKADEAIQLVRGHTRKEGFAAIQEISSVSPWTFLVAPFLLLPPVARIGDRWYRKRAASRACGLQPADR